MVMMEAEPRAGSAWNDDATNTHDQDALFMRKMGLQQETKRRFGRWTILGMTAVMMATWESAIPSAFTPSGARLWLTYHSFFSTAFINGGGVSMIYGYILAFLGALATCASMAEMASMYPVSGGQYHWTAILAPRNCANFLSWLTGWLSTLGWQASTAVGIYLGGELIQSLATLNHPDYVPTRWQGTLLLYAVLALALIFNTILIRLLPFTEGAVFVIHLGGIFLVLVPVVALAPISSNAFVWTQFTDYSGWSSDGVSWLVGQATTAVLFIGYDASCHLAEEVRDASMNVPRAMFFTICINGTLGFVAYILILYSFGNVEAALNSPYGLPFIEIFLNALKSTAGTTAVISLLLALYIFATFGFLASASRQAWAFSRDGGLPLSRIFKQIDSYYHIPVYTIFLTCIISMLLGLINIGSTVAFNAVVSLVVSGYLSSYLIPIILMIIKRVKKEPVHFGPWRLGRWGLPINIFAAAYTLLTVVFTFLPYSLPVNATNMNYSCAVYGGVVIFGIAYYVLWGRRSYTGPAADLENMSRSMR